MLDRLRISSIMSPNYDFFGPLLAGYLELRLGRPVEFVGGIEWQAREQQLEEGEVQVCWICGLPYVWKADILQPKVELLAAPVMRRSRYQAQPLYYSDVVVHRDSDIQGFEDLKGTVWAFNEPNSHSGYNLTRYELARRGQTGRFFRKVIEAGSHEHALRLILRGRIDASAIDSTVLERELVRFPDMANRLRVIDTFGPSPIPPWVIRRDVPEELRAEIRSAMLEMSSHPAGRTALDEAEIERFVRVEDADYDPIREMERIARDAPMRPTSDSG